MTRTGAAFRGVLLIAFCTVVFGDAGCNREPQTKVTAFPASDEVAGWMKTSDARTFEAADLWKYIDGEAERYLKAGVRRVSTADYNFENKFEAVVDIYTMASADGAKNVFESERAGDAQFVQVGDGARLHGQSLVFHKGSYLVRIVAYQESGRTQHALLQLGQVIEQRLAR
ncbi:MAG: hypothetical protein LAO24_20545 [Acidobacteriia bacterium]|nr:hypothetical protein [Terriglobia bacterium]